MMKKLLLLAALVVMLLAVSLIAACSDGGTTSEPVPKDPPVVAPDDPSPPVDPSEEDPFGEPSEGDPSGEDQDEDPDDEPVPPVEFTYTFLGADGSELFSDSVTEGDYIPDDVLVAPSVDHYTFVGWSVGGARVTFPYSPTEDTVFVALYEINVYDYAFVVNGEAELSGSAPALTELTISSAPSVECDHYEFEGWAVNGTVVELPYVLTGDVTFNAVFTPIEYKVIYHLGDMEGKVENDNPDTYTVADIEHVLSALEHPCYGECEWYLDKTFTGEPIEYIPKNGGDVHLYAKWSDPHHFYNEDHVCTVCEEQAEQKGHVFEDSHECTICSFIAANHDYVNGKCVMCGKPCLHEKYDESHHCAECDMPAETLGHEYDTSHKCTICGHEHETRHHVYDNDYLCTICRVAHADHDYGEDHFCEICGRPYGSAEHEYENGVCTVCGKSEVWDGSIADGFSAGSGTAEDPYIIASASELAYLAKLTNEGECSADMYFALGTDIRLGGRSWTPIGKGYTTTEREVVDSAFRGHFDGRGHTVYGLVVNADESAAQEDTEAGRAFACAGLFGAVMGGETNAEVKNLRVSGYEIKFTAAAKDISVNVGGLIGTAHKATVYCCAADGVIEIRTGGDVRAGGLLGGVEDDNRYGSVSACTSDCTITVYAGGVSHVGGMAGYAGFGRFTDCAAFSVIEVECAETVVAGFATGTNAKTVINECFAQTDITCSAGTTDVFAVGCKTESSFFGDGLVNGIPVGSGCEGVSAGDIAEAVASFGSSGLVPTNGTALPYTFAENASVPDDHEHVYNASHECMVCGKPHEISEHSFIGSHECTVCGFIAAEHNYDPETGKCTMCGEECTHDYDGGTCTVCGYKHTAHDYDTTHICEVCGIAHETPGHVYENGSCTICDHEHSPHEYEGSHTCKVCGYTDTSGHVFDSETGICTVCGDACKHEYENGVCTICDYEHTVHNYEGSHVCTVCGYTATDHDYDAATGKCTMCGEECAHDFAGSHVCTVCGYTVTVHDYDAATGKCTMCGEECTHDYDGGTCTVCGYKHTAHKYTAEHICETCGIAYETPEHDYENGVCTICTHEHSPHEYEGSHTCKICGYADTSGHTYDPTTGVCTVCGDACKHDYDNGKCTICGYEHVEHNFENSHICTVCGYTVTDHDYDAATGKCTMCGEECAHDYDDGACTICGYKHTAHDYDTAHICEVCGIAHESPEHVYKNGVCTICSDKHSPHEYEGSHTCKVCGYTDTSGHAYDPTTGVCAVCGDACKHDYDNGKCTICGNEHIEHNFENSHICTVCGYIVTAHDYDATTGKCIMCGEECTHDFADSHVCTVCGYTVTVHDYDAATGKCTMCGEECTHDFAGSHVCTVCGYTVTTHDYDATTGKCTMCGEECAHDFAGSHVCTVCGYTVTAHDYDAATGKCTMCGEECTHDFAGSHVCTVCGYTVTAHDYDATTGKCIMCGEECVHDYDGGTCTVCGYKHTAHDYDTAHICKVCGIAYETPEHVYKNGVCTICGDKHSPHEYEGSHTCKVCGYTDTSGHTYDPETGICTVCGEICEHVYDSGKCTICGYEHATHEYNINHICEICGAAHETREHAYKSGKCTICGHEHTEHNFENSHTCTICGYAVTAHDYDPETGKCTMCGEKCEHSFENSHICTICGYTVTAHNYDPETGKCIMCGEECKHDYENGSCTICGYEHTDHKYNVGHICEICGIAHETPEHTYENGNCTICDHKHSPHEYEGSHTCKVCGYTDMSGHTYDPETGSCTVCGEICKHVYDSGKCTICGYEHTEHNFENSHTCIICGHTVTAHDYDAATGKCTMCGEECEHDYESGTCTICGFKHTDHEYNVDHVCAICGTAHETPEHIYENGSCTICGAEEKWDGTPAESFGGGSGTESEPYIISNAAELAYLAEFTAAGKAVYGTYFSLTADIDLCGNEWTPIGSGYYTESVYADRAFGGTFKGNGHTIRGLVITSAEFEYNGETGRDHASVGLFGAVCGKGTEYAVIQGLTVENAVITLSVSEKDSQTAVGILAGMASSVIMEDCVVSGSITVTTSGRADIGGLIGGIINSNRYGDINGCAADTVMELTVGDELYAGGLVGKASYGKMTGSSAECEINAEGTRMSVAGFAVNYGKYKTKAESCHSFAVITVPDGRNIKCDVFMPGGGDVDSCTYSALSAVNGEAAASSSGAVAV